MKTLAYLDCPSGIAGDMCLAALIDAGVPPSYLHTQLATLGLNHEFTLTVTPTHRQGLRALHAKVALTSPLGEHRHGDHSHHVAAAEHDQGFGAAIAASTTTRNLPAIEHLITQAALPDRAQRWSLAVFRCLAEAEAAVHGIAVDQVHFHEVGATDAIVDIVGTCLGLDYLGIEQLFCSPLPTGRGRVRAAHGWLPVPAPAVLKLLEQRQVPIYSNGLDGELVTPTGAAIVTALAESFGDPPAMTLRCTGLGAGGKELPVANVLRLWIGEAASPATPVAAVVQPAPAGGPYDSDTITLLETQVDDLVPQAVGYLYDRLLAAGALDLFTQPVAMKKSRPGLLITVLCRPEDEPHCTDILFAETSTLGIRRQTQQRWVLSRHTETLETPYGPVALKLAYHPRTQAVLNVHPEYEDCAALARHHNVPWQTVHQTALSLWYQQTD
ncbi:MULTISPECIES: nickel pincer cofactor biosynthesis protein LarC [Cyanophyceae]|uniref:Putative nickel insertion protein n=1 Tax=Leptolyngbya subtilissima DQ-A4 TaxID=2933933 RepID=A0ABV0KCF8_9CYAN|nr:nickel pincer cofactor biosynthesis protein LarC [Nodosilinea sp. FACHB-141]MBD2113373.1 nickel pincer cofactor biosynthesis protein LarC [Nodosilinea sp. FACHB-141]